MQDPEAAAELKKKRAFRKFSYRGIDLDQYVANYTPPPRPTGATEEQTRRALLAIPITTVVVENMDEKHRSVREGMGG
jgi:hypothetical protein